jgi:hypothetical protein
LLNESNGLCMTCRGREPAAKCSSKRLFCETRCEGSSRKRGHDDRRMLRRRCYAGAGSLHDRRLARVDALIEHLSCLLRASTSLREPDRRPLSEAEPLSLTAPVKPKIPALRFAWHDPQLDACAAGVRYVVACLARLQPIIAFVVSRLPPGLISCRPLCGMPSCSISKLTVGQNLIFKLHGLVSRSVVI